MKLVEGDSYEKLVEQKEESTGSHNDLRWAGNKGVSENEILSAYRVILVDVHSAKSKSRRPRSIKVKSDPVPG